MRRRSNRKIQIDEWLGNSGAKLPPRPPLPKVKLKIPAVPKETREAPEAPEAPRRRRMPWPFRVLLRMAIILLIVIGGFWVIQQPFAQPYIDSLIALFRQGVEYLKDLIKQYLT